MARSGFLFVSWAFVFLFLDFRSGTINLFPDFVGYGLFAVGLWKLSPLHRRFKSALPLAVVALITSLTEVVSIPAVPLPVAIVIAVAPFVLQLIIVWQLCTGIAELARSANKSLLADSAKLRRNLYAVLPITAIAAIAVSFLSPENAGLLVTLLFLYGIFVVVMLFLLMRTAYREMSRGLEEGQALGA